MAAKRGHPARSPTWRSLAIRYPPHLDRGSSSGTGEPTVIYDAGAGSSGISGLRSNPVRTAVAPITRICSYDRAGIGQSTEPADRPRVLDDVVDDLHALIAAADVAPPYLLMGESGGGFDVYHQAGRYPDEVAGIIMLDVPAGQVDIAPTEISAWDSPDNPEHMDYHAVEHQMAVERLPIPAVPVTVLTATEGQSADPAEQLIWLEGSSDGQQLIVPSGHDIVSENTDAVIGAITDMLAKIG